MVDANFKLRLKDKGISDQHLAPGWAYFVEDNKFQAYLEKHSEYKTEVCLIHDNQVIFYRLLFI